MGQVMPAVLGHRRPHLVGLKEHLPDVFMRSFEEALQGLVLGRVILPQIAGSMLARENQAN